MDIFKSILNSFKKVIPVNIKVARQIKMSGLYEELILLSQDKTEFDFIGITSNSYDCLYFKKEGNNYNIEFEAVEKTQIPYFEKIKSFAIRNNYTFVEEANDGMPYLMIKTNTDIEQTIQLARHIQNELFGNNENTVYDIVP
ncbi:hypothetical protein [Chryseobacterium sp. OV279]|uniref:hypothetical protein n=1 Tax=Chryseobacterium sp. OV279 TaxID=1500285 RepID=UPI0009174A46|nr:hypothetical protein [Chryseobacterium sp. OV279]SHE62294.1 hypothetical protein SAMN02787100_0474 [Chryseobacterium sp. OV279]